MQRGRITTPITFLILIEIIPVMRTLALTQLLPPVLTQYVQIFRARRAHYFFHSVSLIAFVGISDEHGMSMPQRVFVEINIFVRNAFAEFFFNCIADCRTRGRADCTRSEERRVGKE